MKEIESALGNKTMNDASKKGLFEVLGVGVGGLKREFYRKGLERGKKAIGNKREMEDYQGWQEDEEKIE